MRHISTTPEQSCALNSAVEYAEKHHCLPIFPRAYSNNPEANSRSAFVTRFWDSVHSQSYNGLVVQLPFVTRAAGSQNRDRTPRTFAALQIIPVTQSILPADELLRGNMARYEDALGALNPFRIELHTQTFRDRERVMSAAYRRSASSPTLLSAYSQGGAYRAFATPLTSHVRRRMCCHQTITRAPDSSFPSMPVTVPWTR